MDGSPRGRFPEEREIVYGRFLRAASITFRAEMTAPGEGREPAMVITFYSYTGGVGCTMSVANAAWLLAAAGKRVLVIDLDLDSPGLQPYLRAMLAEDPPTRAGGLIGLSAGFATASADRLASDRPPADDPTELGAGLSVRDLADHVIAVPGGFPDGGAIDFLGPGGRRGSARIEWVGWSDLYSQVDVLRFAGALRATLSASDYDYVLVDSPVGTSLSARVCLTLLPDTVVVGYRLTQQSINAAGQRVTEIVESVARPIRVLPVAMRVGPTPNVVWQLAKRRFGSVLRNLPAAEQDAYLRRACIPELSGYPHDEKLVVLDDRPGSPGEVADALAGLIEIVTEGRVIAPVISEDLKARYAAALERLRPPTEPTVGLVYAAPERPWADWIRAELELAGVQVEQPGSAAQLDAILVLGSDRLTGLSAADPRSRAGKVIGVRVGDAEEYGSSVPGHVLDLQHLPEDAARALLLEQFDHVADLERGLPRVGPRFPGRVPKIFHAPSRNPAFVGRDAALEDLRDRLIRGSLVVGPQPYTLYGDPGAGKSQVALEYIHRFAADYDLVWWIPAQRDADIREALTELAHRLWDKVPGDAVQAVLKDLATGATYDSWLLVYDNADDVPTLPELMPAGSRVGRVILTSRAVGDAPGPKGEMGVFQRQETLRLIHNRVTGLSPDQAEALAEATHDLPLTVELAATCVQADASRLQRLGNHEIMSVAQAVGEYLDQLAERRRELAPECGPLPVSALAAVTLSVDSLRGEELGATALNLVETAAFLSPEGVGRRLLYSPAMLELLRLSNEPTLDTILLDSVLTKISRYALGTVDHGRPQIFRMHRLTQELMRTRLAPERHRALQEETLKVLAAFAPAEADYDAPDHVATFAELQRHLFVSDALGSSDERVRRWITGQIHYLWRTDDAGNWRLAQQIGERLYAGWREDFGPDDPLVLRLAGQLANVCRSLQDIDRAVELDEETLSRQRKTLGLDHPRTLMTALGHGGDLRILGRFDEAYTEDQATWDGCRLALGDDHPVTQSAANNLALSLSLVGAPDEALAMEARNHAQRMRLLGPRDVATWRSARRAGGLLRELGDYEGSRLRLSEALTKLVDLAGRDALETLRADRSLGLTYRCMDRLDDALETHRSVFERYVRVHGLSHNGTLATSLALAGDLHALDRHQEAVNTADRCLAQYERQFGAGHPLTQICRSDLAIYLRAAGRAGEAYGMSEESLRSLQRSLDNRHSFVLAASIGHATNLVAVGEGALAHDLDEATRDAYLLTFGPDHPGTRLVEHNMQAGYAPADVTKRRDLPIEDPLN